MNADGTSNTGSGTTLPPMIFGIRPPEGIAMWWGARVIFKRHWSEERARKRPGVLARWPYLLDYVGDRMQMTGGTFKQRLRFTDKLDKKILPRLQRECARAGLGPEDSTPVTFDLDGYHVEANPRASYGYLYVGVWPVARKTAPLLNLPAPTWENQLREAAKLSDAELRQHALKSTQNRHRCRDCFCCAAATVLEQRHGDTGWQRATDRGDVCAACGHEIKAGEMVYVTDDRKTYCDHPACPPAATSAALGITPTNEEG